MRNVSSIVILGGYGITGAMIAELLLQETGVRIVVAGRNVQRAQEAADRLNKVYEGNRVTGVFCDAADCDSLDRVFGGADFVVVASSTSAYGNEVAAAALKAGIDYLDIQYSSQKVSALKQMEHRIAEAGRCFITDGGFHPGLAAVLVHGAAKHFDVLEAANVSSVIKLNWPELQVGESTVHELVESLFAFDTTYYTNSRWKKGGMFDIRTVNFKMEGFGRAYCFPMYLEELRELPERYPGLQETGFFVGGFNGFVDWCVMPMAMVALKCCPNRAIKMMSPLFKWGLTTFSRPPYGTVLKVMAQGMKDEQRRTVEVTLFHEDGYMLTAIPVVACLLQYLDGSIQKAGLWTQGNLAEPERMMKDMKRMGVRVELPDN